MSNKSEAQESQFKERLDSQHKFPGPYLFKFIVPAAEIQTLKKTILPKAPWNERPSKNGRFVSLSARVTVKSSDEVIAVYHQAKEIKGIISL